MESLRDRIAKAFRSAHSAFKRKKIRFMKKEADKIASQLAESESKLKSIEARVPKDPISRAPLKLHPLAIPKRIEVKIAELNKKIHRAKNRRNKECLITKREALRAELAWGPRQLEGAFSGTYRRYRIDGLPGMDPDIFFSRVRKFLIELLIKESRMGGHKVTSNDVDQIQEEQRIG